MKTSRSIVVVLKYDDLITLEIHSVGAFIGLIKGISQYDADAAILATYIVNDGELTRVRPELESCGTGVTSVTFRWNDGYEETRYYTRDISA